MPKKIILFLLVLILTAGSACAERLAVNLPEGALLVESDGAVVVPYGAWDTIYATGFDDRWIGVSAAEYGLLSERGEALAACDFLCECGDGFLYGADEKFGLMDADGQPLTAARYTRVARVAGGFLALRSDPWDTTPDPVYAVSETGDERETDVTVLDWNEGGALLCALDSKTLRYGYLNANGAWAVAPRFVYAAPFTGNWAKVRTETGVGVIDQTGAYRVSPVFDAVEIAADGGSFILTTGERADRLDSETLRVTHSFAGTNLYAIPTDGAMLIVTGEQTTLLNPDGSAAFSVSRDCEVELFETRCAIQTAGFGNSSARLCDLSGTPLSSGYQRIGSLGLHGGRERFSVTRFDVTMDERGLVTDFDLDSIRMGLMDDAGTLLLPVEYLAISALGEDRFLAGTVDSWQMIDQTGRVISVFCEK